MSHEVNHRNCQQKSSENNHSPVKIEPLYSRLIPFDLQPVWLRDNEFLRANYRVVTHSYVECMKTIFSLHTETFNIWTHLVGFVLVLLITLSGLYIHTFQLSDIQIQLSSLPAKERVLFTAFAVSAAFCLLGSSTFHTFSCHSQSTAKFLNKIDYLGIVVLIVGSTLPLLYYSFFCQPRAICAYSIMTILSGGVCCYLSCSDGFRRRDYRKIRPMVFIAFGCSGIFPIFHLISERGLTELTDRYAIHWFIPMVFSYVFGAFIYSMRIPERFFPGKFDIFAHSHQIFHLFVLLGIAAHYECVLTTASYYHQHQSICN